ncbi:hypothetical protein BHE74_00022369 [Ensete ventricosum]|nr:hypothetical protein BHE74_00022369 [Ensete ventricosum]
MVGQSLLVFLWMMMKTQLPASDAADLEFVQLHGDGSRSSLPILPQQHRIIYVLQVDKNGILLDHVSDEESSIADWLLKDGAKGGSGKGFDWQRLQLPSIQSKHGWLLAGGLHADNVDEAMTISSQMVLVLVVAYRVRRHPEGSHENIFLREQSEVFELLKFQL